MHLFNITPKLYTENRRGEVFGQLTIERLRLFFISKQKEMRTISKLFMYGTSFEGIE